MEKSWSNPKKITFRFCFALFLLIISIQNNAAYPFWNYLWMFPEQLLTKFIPWFGKEILGVKYAISTEVTGSGDTTYDWLKLLFILILSIFSTVIWSFFAKPVKNYHKLYYYLTLAVRYYIALMLINYGLFKVFKLQFPAPSLFRLSQEYGDSSPMGLAWTFLGFSKGYNLFMGVAEICSIFLLFRKTLALGSIITLMTTLNVMAVNYFYDVPVKQMSTILVVFTSFLLAYNFEELFDLFVRNKATQLSIIKQPIFGKKLKLASTIFKYAILFYSIFYVSFELYKEEKLYGDNAPKGKLSGKYSAKNAALLDSNAVEIIFINSEYSAGIRYAGGKNERFGIKYDSLTKKLFFTSRIDTTNKFDLQYLSKGKSIQLAGKFKADSAQKVFEKENIDNKYLLTNRGFHWVNEYPLNR